MYCGGYWQCNESNLVSFDMKRQLMVYKQRSQSSYIFLKKLIVDNTAHLAVSTVFKVTASCVFDPGLVTTDTVRKEKRYLWLPCLTLRVKGWKWGFRSANAFPSVATLLSTGTMGQIHTSFASSGIGLLLGLDL